MNKKKKEKKSLTTYATPLHNHDGRPVGLLSSDLSLEKLREKMMKDIREINDIYEKDMRHQSYLFVIDKEGLYIMHPDKERIMTPIGESIGKLIRYSCSRATYSSSIPTASAKPRTMPTNSWAGNVCSNLPA